MSDTDSNLQADDEAQAEVAPVLTFFERFFLGISFWSLYAVIAVSIVQENSYLTTKSLGTLAFGWVLLCVTSIISLGLWRFLKRGRIRAGIAVAVLFLMFNLIFLHHQYDLNRLWSLIVSDQKEPVKTCGNMW